MKLLLSASDDKTIKLWDTHGYLLMDLFEHTDRVNSAKFSHNEKFFVSASDDKTCKIFNAVTGLKTAEITDHNNGVRGAMFSNDDSKILSYTYFAIKVSDAGTGKLLNNLAVAGSRVSGAEFSPTGKFIIAATDNNAAFVWNTATGKLLFTLKGHTGNVVSAVFDASEKKILTASADGAAKIWDAQTGMLLLTLKANNYELRNAAFSPDGKKVITASEDQTAKVWDTETGKILLDLKEHQHWVYNAIFSNDGKKILTQCAAAYGKETLRVWDAQTGKLTFALKDSGSWNTTLAKFSPSGKTVIGGYSEGYIIAWNAETSEQYINFTGYVYHNSKAIFSPNGKNILTTPNDGTIRVWNAASGKVEQTLRNHKSWVLSLEYSKSGKQFISAGWDSTAIIWNADFKPIKILKGTCAYTSFAHLSNDEKKAITVSHGYDVQQDDVIVWDALTGKQLFTHKEPDLVKVASFSPDAKYILVSCINGDAKILDGKTGQLITTLANNQKFYQVRHIEFNNDGKYIVQSGPEIKIWETATGKLVFTDTDERDGYGSKAYFSPDGSKLLVVYASIARVWDWRASKKLFEVKKQLPGLPKNLLTSTDFENAIFHPSGKQILLWRENAEAELWDFTGNKLLQTFKGHKNYLHSAAFSNDGKTLVTAAADNTCMLWDVTSGEQLYTFFTLYYDDYLVLDKYSRYDGTENARKMLYFTCGTEVIELDQVKDQLWVPNLAERIMAGNTINSSKLSDLELCGLTPLVEQLPQQNGYRFQILPRRGGLGETVLYLNGIELRRYKLQQLKKTSNGYELVVPETELTPYLKSGQDNDVTVIAYTAKNEVSARGMRVIQKSRAVNQTPPNLYAVIVGVSDYKGTELDLRYAAKDAVDISTTLGASARKLLNTDGKEHVFIYNLNTEKTATLPEKLSIKNAFAEVGKKATANDIFLVFFSGHGVMQGESKKFYFLTADASVSSSPEVVGISTDELSDWMKPANIKAQKRILIFDACNSGQAVNEMITIGKTDQNYFAARNDDKSQQIKTIEKLNEKSGLFILSASASNQSAYEMGKYAQGVLTYSLLKTIKEQPDILEDNQYLNVGKWFTAAEKTVTDLVRENGTQQQPQLVSTTSFNIGVVDKDLIANIKLPQAKALFTSSNFQNADENIADDDLEFNKALNTKLNTISAKGGTANISYVSGSNSPDAWSLSGRYKVSGDNITVKVNVKQYRQPPKHTFEVSGKITQLNILVADVVKKVTELTAGNGK